MAERAAHGAEALQRRLVVGRVPEVVARHQHAALRLLVRRHVLTRLLLGSLVRLRLHLLVRRPLLRLQTSLEHRGQRLALLVELQQR